jgi:hypothetical protein
VDDEDTEPPVPAGLADLSGALRAIADFLEIDEDLIAVAAEASPALKEEPAAGLADWIAALPAAEKDKLLTMVADAEGPQVRALLRGSRSGTHADLPRADGRWVNDTCGSAASSHPALDRNRARVATVGDFRPHCCVVPSLHMPEHDRGALLPHMVSARSSKAIWSR